MYHFLALYRTHTTSASISNPNSIQNDKQSSSPSSSSSPFPPRPPLSAGPRPPRRPRRGPPRCGGPSGHQNSSTTSTEHACAAAAAASSCVSWREEVGRLRGFVEVTVAVRLSPLRRLPSSTTELQALGSPLLGGWLVRFVQGLRRK